MVNSRISCARIQTILLDDIQKVYLSQGVRILDRHIEVIIRQMTSKIIISDSYITSIASNTGMISFCPPVIKHKSQSKFNNYELFKAKISIRHGIMNRLPSNTSLWFPGELTDKRRIDVFNRLLRTVDGILTYQPLILGISRASLHTDSFISEASFQQTTRILIKSALEGRIDWVRGLQENVVLTSLTPSGTGLIVWFENVFTIKKFFYYQYQIKNKLFKLFNNIFFGLVCTQKQSQTKIRKKFNYSHVHFETRMPKSYRIVQLLESRRAGNRKSTSKIINTTLNFHNIILLLSYIEQNNSHFSRVLNKDNSMLTDSN
jgi:hypothetical protein